MVKGQLLSRLQADLLLGSGCSSVVVVLGCEGDRIVSDLSPLPESIAVVINENWKRGQFSSLQAGLSALADRTSTGGWVVVAPVDMLGLERTTLEHLLRECNDTYDAVVPTYQGKSGHPVAIAGRICKHLLQQSCDNARLDRLLRRMNVKLVETNDPATLSNLNEPEDLRRLIQ